MTARLDDIRLDAWVAASPAAVFEAWATEAGARSFFAPAARIDARPGGRYEILFMLDAPAGRQGSEGCRVVAIEPPRRLCFTWNFPPHLSIRDARTEVEVAFEAEGDGTRVRLAQRGWPEAPDDPAWAEGHAYFQRAWRVVLDRLVARFTSGPVDWGAAGGS